MRVDHGDLPEGAVFAGVDTHADGHWLCVLDAVGRVLLSERFPAAPEGYDALAAAVRRAGEPVAVGVEGTATYGAGLARRLSELGLPVWEVLQPERRGRPRGSRKSDPVDAERAARKALSGEGLSVPKSRDGWVESARALLAARDRLVSSATAAANAAIAIARSAPEEVAGPLRGMRADRAMPAALGMAEPDDPVAASALRAVRALAESWRASREAAARLLAEIEGLVRGGCPALLAMYGCGAVSAARLAVAAGDNPGRMASEAAFAALCGASPVEASSGRTVRHRLNRGGDRRANSALHQIARHRLDHDPRTRAYAARRRSEGLSDREVMRCLKRYIAREAYRALTGPRGAAPGFDPGGLGSARMASGISQEAACAALGVSRGLISLIELGRGGSPSMRERYRAWVEDGFPIPADQG